MNNIINKITIVLALAMVCIPKLSQGATCGNGVIEADGDPIERCDDGNTDEEDGCSATCQVEPGWDCQGQPSTCHPCQCGDGIKWCIEECDDGADNSDFEPDHCRTNCLLPHCGDFVTDSNEQCDEGSHNSDFVPDQCRTSCTEPVCGDGVFDPSFNEQCDLGDNNSDEEGSLCSTICLIPFCGNGVEEAGEQCDDGNSQNWDECTQACRLNVCGDGYLAQWTEGDTPREVCDDGNNLDGDDCRYDCLQNMLLCGNGNLDSGEECDQSGANSDQPNAPCRLDCSLPKCGDGIVDSTLGETCDRSPNCSAQCQPLPGP